MKSWMLALILFCLGLNTVTYGQEPLPPSDRPIVESVEGEKIIVIKGSKGTRVGTQGSPIEFGESIKTGPRTTVKVRYPDGSKLLIGRSTDMEVTRPKREDQYSTQIRMGQVRALIKTKESKRSFVFKTQTAVLGVRGTDFTFENMAGAGGEVKSEVHALKGVVEVAEDEELLQSGQGVPLGAGEKIQATKAGLTDPEKFDRGQYLSKLDGQQPEFGRWMRSDQDLKSIETASSEKDVSWERTVRILNFQIFFARLGSLGAFPETGGGDPNSGGGGSSGGGSQSSDNKAPKDHQDWYSLGVSWNPELNLMRLFSLRAHLGIIPFDVGEFDWKTWKVEAGLLLSKTIGRKLILEAGAGVAGVWLAKTGIGVLLLANIGWRGDYFGIFERFFIGVDYYNLQVPFNFPIATVKIGFGF